jgi:hypothetical protein
MTDDSWLALLTMTVSNFALAVATGKGIRFLRPIFGTLS